LLRARAIESQAFVVAAAQAGKHKSSRSSSVRETYGNSLVVSPWGAVLARANQSSPEIINVEIEHKDLIKVRTQIPMKDHRRI
jgi:predicted amidohydrolase